MRIRYQDYRTFKDWKDDVATLDYAAARGDKSAAADAAWMRNERAYHALLEREAAERRHRIDIGA